MPDPPYLSQQKVCPGVVALTKYFRHVFLGRVGFSAAFCIMFSQYLSSDFELYLLKSPLPVACDTTELLMLTQEGIR